MFGKFSVNPTLGRLGVYGIFIGFMSVVMYPIMIGPMINSDHYSEYIMNVNKININLINYSINEG